MLRAILVLMVILGAMQPALASSERTVRFGLTAVVVRENLQFFDRWAAYLEARLDRPVEFVQRRSYREIMEMLEAGELDFAWICGYPFVQERSPEFVELLAVPVFEGSPLYRSYIITQRDSPYQTLDDLDGRVFAFSDPASNSGYLVPRAMLAHAGHAPDEFFRLTFFSYSHAETIQAVAEGVADGGAVDSYVWEFMKITRPQLTERTRVIQRSRTFGFPPLVSRLGVEAALRDRMREGLVGMSGDPDGRNLLADLALDGFAIHPSELYESIRVMARRLGADVRTGGAVIETATGQP